MINKNVLMILGTFVTTTATASLAMQQIVTKGASLEDKQFAPISSSKIHIIDLAETNSVEDLLKKFNSFTNVFMPESILNLTESTGFLSTKLSEKSFNKLKNYTKNINFQYEKVLFGFGKDGYEIDLTPIKEQIDIIKKKLDVDYSKVLSSGEATKLITSTMSKAPNMVALLKDMTGLKTAFQMAPMASIPDKGYLNYLDMMNAYHHFSWQISQSTVYKKWASAKNISYKLIKSGSIFSRPKIDYVAHGKGYDLKSNISKPVPQNPQELHNLEAQLVLSLTNLYGIAS